MPSKKNELTNTHLVNTPPLLVLEGLIQQFPPTVKAFWDSLRISSLLLGKQRPHAKFYIFFLTLNAKQLFLENPGYTLSTYQAFREKLWALFTEKEINTPLYYKETLLHRVIGKTDDLDNLRFVLDHTSTEGVNVRSQQSWSRFYWALSQALDKKRPPEFIEALIARSKGPALEEALAFFNGFSNHYPDETTAPLDLPKSTYGKIQR